MRDKRFKELLAELDKPGMLMFSHFAQELAQGVFSRRSIVEFPPGFYYVKEYDLYGFLAVYDEQVGAVFHMCSADGSQTWEYAGLTYDEVERLKTPAGKTPWLLDADDLIVFNEQRRAAA